MDKRLIKLYKIAEENDTKIDYGEISDIAAFAFEYNGKVRIY